MNTYIGIDFGGTKLLIGEIDEEGNVLRNKRYDTGIRNQLEATEYILNCLIDYIDNVGFVGTPVAAGVGVVGVVNPVHGVWNSMDHTASTPVPLGKLVEEKLGVPVAVDNDVKCATSAELLFGQGKHSKNFIYINVGTGIAAGFVVEGRILRGAHNNSGEVGHSVLDLNRREECICGRKGCVEGIAAGSGFHKQAVRLYDTYETNLERPSEKVKVQVKQIFKLADDNDPLCQELVKQAVENLSCLIMNLVRVTDPDTIILGGGVIRDGWLLPKIANELNPSTMRGVTNGIKISSFDAGYVGLIGAGAIAKLYLEQCKKEEN